MKNPASIRSSETVTVIVHNLSKSSFHFRKTVCREPFRIILNARGKLFREINQVLRQWAGQENKCIFQRFNRISAVVWAERWWWSSRFCSPYQPACPVTNPRGRATNTPSRDGDQDRSISSGCRPSVHVRIGVPLPASSKASPSGFIYTYKIYNYYKYIYIFICIHIYVYIFKVYFKYIYIFFFV